MRRSLRSCPAGAAIALAGALLGTPAARAAQATSTFTVTATVTSGCTVSATNLAFGLYDSTSLADRSGSSTITVMCSLGTPYSVGLDLGQYASAGVRRMALGADRLTYQLFRDAALSLPFGAIGSGLTVPGVGTGIAQSVPVFGLLPAAQVVPLGAYTDTVTVTVEY